MKIGDLVKYTEDTIALVTGEADTVGFLVVNNEDREVFVDEGILGILIKKSEELDAWHVCFSNVGSLWMSEDYLEIINENR